MCGLPQQGLFKKEVNSPLHQKPDFTDPDWLASGRESAYFTGPDSISDSTEVLVFRGGIPNRCTRWNDLKAQIDQYNPTDFLHYSTTEWLIIDESEKGIAEVLVQLDVSK